MKIPSFGKVTKMELLSFWSIVWILFFSLIYLFALVFLLNYRLILAEGTLSLFLNLFLGLFTAFSPTDTAITLLSALLVGINLFLIGRTIAFMSSEKHVKFSIGGATILGLISTGCSSCGFSILSILGLGSLFSFLPFKGMELHLLSLGLLLFSAWYMLKKLRDSLYCKR